MRAGERLWAVGDITGHGAFTHVSMYQAAVVVRDVLGQDGPWADYRAVSRVTFTDPEVGSVGLTEQQAREAGLTVLTATSDIPESSRGWIHGPGNDGVIKLVADADRGVLVGATVGGADRWRGAVDAGHRGPRGGPDRDAAEHALRLPDLPPGRGGGARRPVTMRPLGCRTPGPIRVV